RNEAARGVDLRIDAGDPPFEHLARTVEADADRLTDVQLAEALLRYGKIDAHEIEILQRDDAGARRQILTLRHARNAHSAGEGRAKLLLLQHRFQLGNLGGGIGGRRFGSLQRYGGADAALAELAGTLQGFLVETGLGPRGGKVGLLHGIIELDEHVPGRYALIGAEVDLSHDTRGFHRQVD